MKTNAKIYTVMVLFYVLLINPIYAKIENKEQRYFTILKVYGLTQNTPTFKHGSMESKRLGENMFEYYLNVFDSYNYKKVRNDEFEKNNYYQKMTQKMFKGINDVKFDKKYAISTKASFGEYSFLEHSFSVAYNLSSSFNRLGFYFDMDNYFESEIEILNSDAYKNIYIKMSEAQAKTFISKRKDINGRIDRAVYLKFTYSVVNKKTITRSNSSANLIGRNMVVYLYSIDIYNDVGLSHKLGSIYSDVDYYDKINGVKIKDGIDTIYYNEKMESCTKEIAKYYRVINYSNGKISGTVKNYYISGYLQLEGTYNDYWAEDGYGNGLFTWYHENGRKSVEVNYVNGKQHGLYMSWHNNGAQKEIVKMINGKKEGCDYIWSENGKPIGEGWTKYYVFYKNGDQISNNRQCPIKPWTQETVDILVNENQNGETTVSDYKYLSSNNVGIVGEWHGRGEYSGKIIKIYKDYNCEWQTGDIIYKGKAEYQDISINDRKLIKVERWVKIIEKAINMKIRLYDKNMLITMSIDNRNDKMYLSLFEADSKLYAFGGGESYYEHISEK